MRDGLGLQQSPKARSKGRRWPTQSAGRPAACRWPEGVPSAWCPEYAAWINCIPITPDRQTPARRQRGL